MSSETFREQVERCIQMISDDGQTWDLTQNDQAALKAVLERLAILDEQVQSLLAGIKFVVEHSNGISNEAFDRSIALVCRIEGSDWIPNL